VAVRGIARNEHPTDLILSGDRDRHVPKPDIVELTRKLETRSTRINP